MNDVSKKRNRRAAIIIAVCTLFVVAFSFAALSIPISADSTTTDLCTIFYLPNVEHQGQFNDWSFVSDTYYNYTGSFTVFMVYKTDNAIGNWGLSCFDGGTRIEWDDFSNSSEYAVAVGYIETDVEFYGELLLTQTLLSSFLTSNTDVEYLILCDESAEQGAYYIAKSLCAMAEIGSDAHVFLDDIRHSINTSYDNGLDIGREEGAEIAYDDIINEQKPIWEQEAFDRGVLKGRDDEYQYIIDNYKLQWEQAAFDSGKQAGYVEGVADANTFTPQKVPFAIMDAIGTLFQTFLNVDIFGINLFGLFSAIITICVGVFVFKKIL